MYFICELCRMLICILFVNSICIFKDCFSAYFYVSFFQHCHVWLITMSSHILGFQNFQTTPLEFFPTTLPPIMVEILAELYGCDPTTTPHSVVSCIVVHIAAGRWWQGQEAASSKLHSGDIVFQSCARQGVGGKVTASSRLHRRDLRVKLVQH